MTINERIAAHRELWTWLAANPALNKIDWPGWHCNGGNYNAEIYDCFMCQYGCRDCPLEWPLGNEGKSVCNELGGIYVFWIYAGSPEERSRFAQKIAELPVKKSKLTAELTET